MKKVYVYRKFVIFTATPQQFREKEFGYVDQKGFAKANGISERHLGTWKRLDEFWPEVSKAMDVYLKQFTPSVRGAMLNKILKTGDAAEVKLWHQLVEDWSEKIDNNININRQSIKKLQDANVKIFERAKERNKNLGNSRTQTLPTKTYGNQTTIAKSEKETGEKV
jgi:hypothetical protein